MKVHWVTKKKGKTSARNKAGQVSFTAVIAYNDSWASWHVFIVNKVRQVFLFCLILLRECMLSISWILCFCVNIIGKVHSIFHRASNSCGFFKKCLKCRTCFLVCITVMVYLILLSGRKKYIVCSKKWVEKILKGKCDICSLPSNYFSVLAGILNLWGSLYFCKMWPRRVDFFFNADLKSSRLSNSPQKFTKNSLHLP